MGRLTREQRRKRDALSTFERTLAKCARVLRSTSRNMIRQVARRQRCQG